MGKAREVVANLLDDHYRLGFEIRFSGQILWLSDIPLCYRVEHFVEIGALSLRGFDYDRCSIG